MPPKYHHFSALSTHSEPLVPSWHEFQNAVAVKKRAFAVSQSCTDGVASDSGRHQSGVNVNCGGWSVVRSRFFAGAASLDVPDRAARVRWKFSNCTTFCRAALSLHHTHTSLSTGVDCCGVHMFAHHYRLLHWTKFPVLLPLHINLSSEWHLTDFPARSVACYPYYKSCFLPKCSILDRHRSYPYFVNSSRRDIIRKYFVCQLSATRVWPFSTI
jgi:hypothetical protein